MEEDKINIESKVMDEITSGRVKLRSRYIFLAEKLGLGSALALTILLAVLFFNLVLYYLKASDNIGYLSFGSNGLFAFLESFPYLLVVVFVFLILVAGYIFKKTNIAYKKPFGYMAIGLVLSVLLVGVVLTYTGIAEKIEEESYRGRPAGFLFRPFLKHGFDQRKFGVAGRVIELNKKNIVLQTPGGLIKIETLSGEDLWKKIAVNNFIIAIGEKREDVFVVQKLRVIDEDDLPMIKHGVRRRFGPPTTSFFHN